MEPNVHEAIGAGIRLIGHSAAFQRALALIARVARTDATVLINGETGTGKDVVARYIHYAGARRSMPFIAVNCGALPDSLLENELFGHTRGAFTDARSEQAGLVQLAEGGTLFLDEIDSLTPRAQVALLRFLEEHRFRPLGSGEERTANARVLAACNRPIEPMCARGDFRKDLYYRIRLIHVELPPLRERSGDAAELADFFILQCAARYSCPGKRLHPESLRWLDSYAWPGNVRELENLIHAEFLLGDGDELRLQAPALDVTIAPARQSTQQAVSPDLPKYQQAKAEAVEQFDRAYLARVLAKTNGNVTSAARIAGKERRALGKLLKRYNIPSTAPRS